MSNKYERNHTGRKYGHLTMLQKIDSLGGGKGALWKAKCDCGRMVEVVAKNAAGGRVKTCGKCRYHRDLRTKLTPHDLQYASVVSRAVQEGIQVELTVEEYNEIIGQDCALCGDHAPKCDTMLHRVDHTQAVRADNSVPLCKPCSRWVGKSTIPDTIDRMLLILDKLGLNK